MSTADVFRSVVWSVFEQTEWWPFLGLMIQVSSSLEKALAGHCEWTLVMWVWHDPYDDRTRHGTWAEPIRFKCL